MLVDPHPFLYILKQVAQHHSVAQDGLSLLQVPEGHLVALGNVGKQGETGYGFTLACSLGYNGNIVDRIDLNQACSHAFSFLVFFLVLYSS